MADSIFDFDPVPGNNTLTDGIPYGPNQLYHNQIDNLFRAFGGKLGGFVDDLGAVQTPTGSATAVAVTLSQGFTAYGTAAGQIKHGTLIALKMPWAATAAATLDVNSIGTKKIRRQGDAAIEANDWFANGVYLFRYDTAYDGATGAWVLLNPSATALPPGYLYGLTTSNGTDATNDINVSTGICRSAVSAVNIEVSTAFGKQLDAVYASGGTTGSPTGGRFDTSISDGWWHVFVITNGSTVGCGFSKSLVPTGQANYPSGYTEYRRIGSFLRASGVIVGFTQRGDEFLLNVPAYDINFSGTIGTTATLQALTVPTGIQVDAIVNVGVVNAGSIAYFLLTSPDQTDTLPTTAIWTVFNSAAGAYGYVSMNIRTNTSGQVRLRASAASSSAFGQTRGWIDTRGRDQH